MDKNEIKQVLDGELSKLSGTQQESNIRNCLVPLRLHHRTWDYAHPPVKYPCWTVGRIEGIPILFSVHGHGKVHPWGVGLDKGYFGPDALWHHSLEQAYCFLVRHLQAR